MLVRALPSVLLAAALCGTDKLPQRARELSLADSYLPPPSTYLPPPSSGYLPPSKEYLPPPPSSGGVGLLPPSPGGGGLLPPSPGAGGLFPPSPGAGGLLPPSPGAGGLSPPEAEAEAALVQPPPVSLSSVVVAGPPSKAPGLDSEQPVVLDSAVHPGFCPRRQLTQSCLLAKSASKACYGDGDCGPRQKCCALDCGLQCVDAVLRPSSCDEVVCGDPGEECVDLETGPTCIGHSKPGQCPFFGQHCSNRILVCQEDTDCQGDKLCCNIACHRLCVEPASSDQRLRFCPAALARPPTRCGFQCRADDDCPSQLKCCDNACGKVCQPGVVPFITCANRNCPPNTRCEMLGLQAVCKAL